MKDNKLNKKIRVSSMCAALSVMLGITSMIGCSKNNFSELSSIYSYGNTFLSDENKNKYEFSRENIRVASYYDDQYKIIILSDKEVYSDYIVSPNPGETHFCNLGSDHITLLLDNVSFRRRCQYFPLEMFLNDEEKSRDSFYIEELVAIQERMNEKEKTLSLKPNNN